MKPPRHIAVIDIGKTNVKLAMVDLDTLTEFAVVTRPNTVLPGPPWRHFDAEGHWSFLLEALAGFHREHRIDAISITTHGACAALLDRDGKLAAPVLDYEDTGPDSVAATYDCLRPPFSETGSARLSMGLNIGAQLHWQFVTDPSLPDRTETIVTWPQYWGFRLTGVAATDMTSLGCHSDLWAPEQGTFSSLVDRLGIRGKLAAPRHPADVLGPILPEISAATGLDPETPVVCGIHDSNASLLPHIIARETPFSVVSTGTWVICMAVGGTHVSLDPARDTLINVNALGNPVPSARFMGGREYEVVSGGTHPEPSETDVNDVLGGGIMLLPAVEPGTGPFQGRKMRWLPTEPAAGSGRRTAALSFYLALMTSTCLAIIGAQGPTIVEGPFARNALFLDMLRAATGRDALASGSATGTSIGAALLYDANRKMTENHAPGAPPSATLRNYATRWQELTAAPA